MLPLTLFEATDSPLRANGKIGSEVSALLFYRTASDSELCAYGFVGKKGVNPDGMLERADKRLFGTKIIEPPAEAEQRPQPTFERDFKREQEKQRAERATEEQKAQKPPAKPEPQQELSRDDLRSFHDAAAKTREELKDDPYLCEDTTLADIDMVAEENYYEKERGPSMPPQRERHWDFHMEFYDKIRGKLQIMLDENERDEALCNLIPESQFVKIYYDRDKYYSVGVVRENGTPSYLCYSVPQERASEPPEEFEGLCRWFPKDIQNPDGEGYWILFQNLTDGSYIKVL